MDIEKLKKAKKEKKITFDQLSSFALSGLATVYAAALPPRRALLCFQSGS